MEIKRAVMDTKCEQCGLDYIGCNLIIFEDGPKQFVCPKCTYYLERAEQYLVRGFEKIENKIVKPGSQSSGRIYLPEAWIGKRVTVVRLDP